MKLKIIFKDFMTITILFMTVILSSHNAAAQDLSYKLPQALVPVVSDKAGILTDYEEVTIMDRFTELKDSSGFQFIFMTVTGTEEYARGSEVETMYNMYDDELFGTGTVLFLISTDRDNLICEIQAYSHANEILTHEICSYINGKLRSYIENGNYYDGIMQFFEYYNLAVDGSLEITDGSVLTDSNSFTAYIKSHMTLVILLSAISILFTALLYAFIFARRARRGRKENGRLQKMPKESSVFVGNISYKYKLTSDRVTYIRSRVSNPS